MEISGAKIEDLPPQFQPLMEAFRLSPYHVAPERRSELASLLKQHGVGIYLKPDAKDWLFDEWRMGKLIWVGTRTLERLWAYCYGYTAITTELQKAAGVFNNIQNKVEYQLGFEALEWAKQATLADREGQWPDWMLDPSNPNKLEHIKTANHIFLMASGRILLHEFAHAVRNHSTDPETPPEIKKREELEADSWADSWMLDKWRDYKTDEKVFIGRCLGIAFAHVPPLIFGIDKQVVSTSHPSPIQRVLPFIDSWLPNGKPADKRLVDLPCGFLLVIVGYLLWKKNQPFEWEPLPDSYHELFTRFEPYFK